MTKSDPGYLHVPGSTDGIRVIRLDFDLSVPSERLAQYFITYRMLEEAYD